MTDPQTAQVAENIVQAWMDRSLSIEDLLRAKHPWLRESLEHDIAAELQKAYAAGARAERAACAQVVEAQKDERHRYGLDHMTIEFNVWLYRIVSAIRARGGA